MLGMIVARIGRNLGLNTHDIDRAATMAREGTREQLSHAWLTRLRNGSLVLIDFNTSADLPTAMELFDSDGVEVSQPLSEIVDEAREALTDALQLEEMKRTTDESY